MVFSAGAAGCTWFVCRILRNNVQVVVGSRLRRPSLAAPSLLPGFVCVFQTWRPGIPCPTCHMTLSDQSAPSAHSDRVQAQSSTRAPPRVVHFDARYECEVCGRKFTATSSLKFHLRTVHSADAPTFECEVCCKKFTKKGHLSEHLRTVHSADAPKHECRVCGRKFTRRSNMNWHLRTVHNPDRPRFKCGVCGKKFATKAGLGLHLRALHNAMALDTSARLATKSDQAV